jgi:hypothetical protein
MTIGPLELLLELPLLHAARPTVASTAVAIQQSRVR